MIELTDEDRVRLYLWSSAIDECRRLLLLADRAESESKTPEALEKYEKPGLDHKRDNPHLSQHAPGPTLLSELMLDTEKYPPIFGGITDCWHIARATRMLAIVFFCQALKSGYQDEGKISGNSRAFVNKHLQAIAMRIFATAAEVDRFFTFCASLTDARDSAIAHADGPAFEVHRTPAAVSMRLHYTVLEGIDFKYFLSILAPLHAGIIAYTHADTS